MKRIDKPDDKFRKISHSQLGKTVHKYFGLPGKFIGTLLNEIPDGENKEKRTDGGYKVELDGDEMIILIEDESSGVNKEELLKIFGYSVTMRYLSSLPVFSVITTTVPLEGCDQYVFSSPTNKFLPIIISFNEFDGNQRLEKARIKVRNNEWWNDVEGYDLVNIPKMFDDGNDMILEEVCVLFSKMRMENKYIKYALGRCLRCMISKYAITLDDVARLEGVIDMFKLKGDAYAYLEEIREEGRVEGRVDLARKIAERLGMAEAVEISGLSEDQILNSP